MAAYYNEIDKDAAQWLRNLIAAGHIAPGDVDERSIEDVSPDDLRGYTQHHFFAGIGVWSYALRQAGWPDDRPVWTGSCPCQPFSAAGAQAGFADERHLWPAFYHLIQELRPPVVFGEQVASKAAEPWLDLVQADLEAVEYAFGAIAFPSASVGAPHIRDRTFWVAYAEGGGRGQECADTGRLVEGGGTEGVAAGPVPSDSNGGLGDAPVGTFGTHHREPGTHVRPQDTTRGHDFSGGLGNPSGEPGQRDAGGFRCPEGEGRGPWGEDGHFRDGHPDAGETGGVADADGGRIQEAGWRPEARTGQPGAGQERGPTGPTNGFWRDADWLFCRDGKWRPVRPGSFPLVDGAPSRVVRLRAYGNAINAEAAREFIEAYLEASEELLG